MLCRRSFTACCVGFGAGLSRAPFGGLVASPTRPWELNHCSATTATFATRRFLFGFPRKSATAVAPPKTGVVASVRRLASQITFMVKIYVFAIWLGEVVAAFIETLTDGIMETLLKWKKVTLAVILALVMWYNSSQLTAPTTASDSPPTPTSAAPVTKGT